MSDLTRLAHRPRALPLLGAALLVVVGLVLTWSSVGREPGIAVLGALMLGLGVCSALVQLLRGDTALGDGRWSRLLPPRGDLPGSRLSPGPAP